MDIMQELNSDVDKIALKIKIFIKDHLVKYKKKGIVIGVSGGVDSAVMLTLCVQELGAENVYGLLLPEEESAVSSKVLGAEICKKLDVEYKEVSISPIIKALDVYNQKDALLKRTYPEYNPKIHKTSLILPDFLSTKSINAPYIKLVKDGKEVGQYRLKAQDYLELIGLQGVKQRSRMIIQYMYAEQKNYLVCGTTNKTELSLGQFVKYGDGGVDIEPLADCYKVQVYALAKYLDIEKEIIERPPSADTWSNFTSDQDFYWRMPIEVMDQLLYSQEHNLSVEEIEKNTQLSKDTIQRAQMHLNGIKNTTEYIRAAPPICYFDK